MTGKTVPDFTTALTLQIEVQTGSDTACIHTIVDNLAIMKVGPMSPLMGCITRPRTLHLLVDFTLLSHRAYHMFSHKVFRGVGEVRHTIIVDSFQASAQPRATLLKRV